MASIIARNYSDAIFEIAKKNSKIESFKSELNDVKKIFLSSEDLRKIIEHPDVSIDDKLEIIEKIFKFDKYIVSFLKVLALNNRFSNLVSIVEEYETLANESLDIEVVKVTSAIKLKDDDLKRIKEVLVKRLNKKVELREVIDPSCLAGIKVILKDEILDNTIDTKIKNIKNMISKTVVREGNQ